MAYIPNIIKTSDLSSEVLNAIGADIGVGVTVAQDDAETLYNYGKVVLATSAMQNKFLSALVNKIAKAEYTSRSYRNTLARLKKGVLDFGETIEEIFVELANVVKENENYASPSSPIPTSVPAVYAAYHPSNWRAKYPTTVKQTQLEKAFLSFNAVDEMISRIVESVYTAHNYDEYLLTKFKIAQAALGRIAATKQVNVTDVASDDGKAALIQARIYGKALPTKPHTEYNEAGVHAVTNAGDFEFFIPATVEGYIDVTKFAAAFNLEYASFLGQTLTLDENGFAFTADEKARLKTGMGLANWPFSAEEDALLANIQMVIADKNLLQIYDRREPKFTEFYNGSDDIWNYWLHVDQIFAISPFSNIVVITKSTTTAEITFNKNNASATGTMAKQNVSVGMPTQLNANAFSLTGYTFSGWATTSDGAKAYDDEDEITASGNTTLYAVWTENT